MTFPNFLCPKRWKKLGRPNWSVRKLKSYAQLCEEGRIRPPTKYTVCSVWWCVRHVWNVQFLATFVLMSFFLKQRFGIAFNDFLTFLWNFKISNFENFEKETNFWTIIKGSKNDFKKSWYNQKLLVFIWKCVYI